MLAKPDNGERRITLVTLLYATAVKYFKAEIAEWEVTNHGEWDDAVKNSSALRAATLRRFREEVCVATGNELTATYSDVDNFYDSIHLPTLCKHALDPGFPVNPFSWGCQDTFCPKYFEYLALTVSTRSTYCER